MILALMVCVVCANAERYSRKRTPHLCEANPRIHRKIALVLFNLCQTLFSVQGDQREKTVELFLNVGTFENNDVIGLLMNGSDDNVFNPYSRR
jgi:hypothetical protein